MSIVVNPRSFSFFAFGMGLFLTVTGCSTAKVRVMPQEDGSNKIVVTDIERDDAEKVAVDRATEYCIEQNKKVAFVKVETKYTGTIPEETRNLVRQASRVAHGVGFQQRVGRPMNPGHMNTSPGTLETAGSVGEGMTDDRDYRSEVIFKCQ